MSFLYFRPYLDQKDFKLLQQIRFGVVFVPAGERRTDESVLLERNAFYAISRGNSISTIPYQYSSSKLHPDYPI